MKQVHRIHRQTAHPINLKLGKESHLRAPRAWLTFGIVPMNSCRFLACYYLNRFRAFTDILLTCFTSNLMGQRYETRLVWLTVGHILLQPSSDLPSSDLTPNGNVFPLMLWLKISDKYGFITLKQSTFRFRLRKPWNAFAFLFSFLDTEMPLVDFQPRGPLTRYVKLWVAHAPGMPGTFSPFYCFACHIDIIMKSTNVNQSWYRSW